jgi:hypothetical protein
VSYIYLFENYHSTYCIKKIIIIIFSFSLCTTLSLQWEPEIIAVALMYLAGKLSKFDVVDWNGRQSKHLRWWDMFVEDVTMDLLEGSIQFLFVF